MSIPAVFDLHGPLPEGTTVLEASAGTGKTFTIAALATRYVAQGRAELRELMLVTFGREATSELRDRVRERLVSAELALRGPDPAASSDPIVALLAKVDDDELARRRKRLSLAISQLDAATITTTHGFCQQMLRTLGIAADVDPTAHFVQDVTDVRREVTDDVYLRRFADQQRPALTPDDVAQLGQRAVSDHASVLAPAQEEPDTLGGQRFAVAEEIRRETLRRKRAGHLMDYDDLLVLLRDTLTHEMYGETAADRVRQRYRVVMVDEFQDTDPVQWEILRTAFHTRRTLVLIGDPKQAIYAFRGADVVAYLDAQKDADTIATLSTSWRSDGPLLRGLDTVLGGAALGDERIVVRPVVAAHKESRFDGGPPVRLRQVTRESLGLSARETPVVGASRKLIATDVAACIAGRLGHDRLLETGTWRLLEPGDIAVLTRTNAQAESVQAELTARGVPAVVSGQTSVFGTASARDWLTLLAALEQPGAHGRAAALALTPFIGWDARRLANAADRDHDELADTVRYWARLLNSGGMAILHEALTRHGLAARLLRTAGGERRLTDLRHVGEVLHAASMTENLGAAALTGWLRRRIREASEDFDEECSRRLDTDAAAVQVVTVHASKGLEFGVVYVPFAWDRYESDAPATLRFHADDGTRILHVGGPGSFGYDTAQQRDAREDRGEDLRLLYVALTRARHQVVVHWAPTKRNSSRGALTRVLLGERTLGSEPSEQVPQSAMTDTAVTESLRQLAVDSDGVVAVEEVAADPGTSRWIRPAAQAPELKVARTDRWPDTTWRRSSYSALTAAAYDLHRSAGHAAGVHIEPDAHSLADEPQTSPDSAVAGATGGPGANLPSPMADQPAGAAFGTLVHEVLEYVDTTAANLDAEIRARCAAAAHRMPELDLDSLAAALSIVARTPLGPMAGGKTLAEITPADRLAELEFELPLAAGAGTTASRAQGAVLADIARCIGRYLHPDDAFADYPAVLTALADVDPDAPPLRGYLTGSIDAVLRVMGANGQPRFLVADYKTNWLGAPGVDLTAQAYQPVAMAQAMMAAHYPLQLMLYLVGLHRYLRWRIPGYDPSVHLGGGLYLFVRGMCGPETPVGPDGSPFGVLAWQPPTGLVEALSSLLDRGRSA